MLTLDRFLKKHHNTVKTYRRIKMRSHLNADTLYARIREDFDRVKDHRASNAKVSLSSTLMSGFAMFCLKDPSLLAFDERRQEDPDSLHTVFGIEHIPCDSQMRSTLDLVSARDLRRPFKTVFAQLQRGKVMEKMTWLDDHYLLALDGTGVFTSEKMGSDYCLRKKKRNGKIEYYQQMLAGAFVHPDRSEVIPTCPEMIVKQDGSTKNDCERNAAKRYLADLRREHPHLKIIVTEDALSSNAPHILELQKHNLRYVLGVKPKDHEYLFQLVDEAVEAGTITEFHLTDPKNGDVHHCFRLLNSVPLNKSSEGSLLVNFMEYWETDNEGNAKRRFSWVTDFKISRENAYQIMRAGRARWRIENETFNTLKNQGYNLEHNYGLGKKHLSAVFIHLMMLAFLVDQVQQLCCPLFQAARAKCRSKSSLWEKIRIVFKSFLAPSMEAILHCIASGIPKQKMEIQWE
jgi:hypothetical protein